MPTVLQLNDKQDKIQSAWNAAERDVSSKLEALEEWAVKIRDERTNQLYGKQYGTAKKKWEVAKKRLSSIIKQSNKNITAIQKQHAREQKQENPGELLKSGEWTPAHAIRIRKGRLEILR